MYVQCSPQAHVSEHSPATCYCDGCGTFKEQLEEVGDLRFYRTAPFLVHFLLHWGLTVTNSFLLLLLCLPCEGRHPLMEAWTSTSLRTLLVGHFIPVVTKPTNSQALSFWRGELWEGS